MKIVKIKWRDSQMYITQESQEINFDYAIIESVGFLIKKDKTKLVLAGDLVGEDYRRVLVIPIENIIK